MQEMVSVLNKMILLRFGLYNPTLSANYAPVTLPCGHSNI